MKSAPVFAFAVVTLAASAASAQDAGMTRALDDAPLVVESNGRPQEVRVQRYGLPVCSTPCTLHLGPGPHTVWTSGRGLRVTEVPLMVPPEGARVRVRAASRAALIGGSILTAFGGAAILIGGGLATAAYASAPHDEYNQMYAVIWGGMALVLGVPALISGVLLVTGAETGFERVEPAAAPRWTLGVAPLQGGALAGATVTF